MRNHIGFCLPASVLIRRKLQYQVGSSDMINQWFRINFLKKYDRKWTKFLRPAKTDPHVHSAISAEWIVLMSRNIPET